MLLIIFLYIIILHRSERFVGGSIQPVLNGWTSETWSKKMNTMARRAGQAGRAGFAAGDGSLVQYGLYYQAIR